MITIDTLPETENEIHIFRDIIKRMVLNGHLDIEKLRVTLQIALLTVREMMVNDEEIEDFISKELCDRFGEYGVNNS